MSELTRVKQRIDALTKAAGGIEYSHSQSILSWLLKLKPDADLALQIAALGHDIDRCIFPRIRKEDFPTYDEYKKTHAARSAKLMRDLLRKEKIPRKMITRVSVLVRDHEIGGKGDVEILKEADSLSFFENNLEDYLQRDAREVKDKIIFMYVRLSPAARALVHTIRYKNKRLRKIVEEVVKKK